MVTFSKFNLFWRERKSSIQINGDLVGQIKLRKWLFDERKADRLNIMQIADSELLELIAKMHYRLILNGQTVEAIISFAQTSNTREDFMTQINVF
jgi:hypothetical protein